MTRSRTPLPFERTPVREAGDPGGRDALARAIPRRRTVSWWVGLALAAGFAAIVTPAITAERWPLQLRAGTVRADQPAPFTVRAPMLAGYDQLRVRGGVVVARGEAASREEAAIADAIADGMPRGPAVYLALFALTWVLAALGARALQRSSRGRLLRVQLATLGAVAVVAVAAKLVLLATAASALVIPVAVLALVPALALDRHAGRAIGLATGVLGALVVSLLAPFDLGLAILLVIQAATAGVVVAARPERRWLAALVAGLAAAVCTSASYVLLAYLTGGPPPELRDPLHAPWLAAAIGPALAGVLAAPLVPLYQRLIGEITRGALARLDDLAHPLLRQIAERAPGTWQHALMIANLGEDAADAIGADGRLVRVGAYFHDLGKSLQPTYFVENLEPGETSPHDRLPAEASYDAMFAHVPDGIAAARKARLHDRIIDFIHMHHGGTVNEPLWARCQNEGNPKGFTVERFRYPGPKPQSRETAILALCDALEASSRTLHHLDTAAIDALVDRTIQAAVRRGQLDDSDLSAGDLRHVGDSLAESLRLASRRDPRHDTSAAATALTVPLPRLHDDERTATVTPSDAAGTGTSTPSDEAFAITADLVTSNERPGLHARATLAVASSRPASAVGPSGRTAARPPTARDASADLDAARTGRAPAFSSPANDAHAADAVERSVRESARTIDTRRAAEEQPAAAARASAAAPPDDTRSRSEAPRSPEPARSRDEAARSSRDEAARLRDEAARLRDEAARAELRRHTYGAHLVSEASRETARPEMATDALAAAPEGSIRESARPGNEVVTIIPRRHAVDRPRASSEPAQTAMLAERATSAAERDARAEAPPPGTLHAALTTLPGPPPAPKPGPLPPPPELITPSMFRAVPATPPPLAHHPLASQPLATPLLASQPLSASPPPSSQPLAAPAVAHAPAASPLGSQPLPIPRGHTFTPGTGHPRPPTVPPTVPKRHLTADPTRTPDAAWTDPARPVDAARPSDAARPTDTARTTATSRSTDAARPADTARTADAPKVADAVRTADAARAADVARATDAAGTTDALSTRPAGPNDPAQIAAALAAIVSRVSAAPFGMPRGPSSAPASAPSNRPASASPSAPPIDDDSRTTQPRMATQSPVLGIPIGSGIGELDGQFTASDLESRATGRRDAATDFENRTTDRRSAFSDASATEPSIPAMPALAVGDERSIDLVPAPATPAYGTPAPAAPAHGTPAQGAPAQGAPGQPWSSGLASRVDAVLVDEWAHETPVVAPTSAELRVLFGQPDPTRQLPPDEVEQLQRRAAELAEADRERRAVVLAEAERQRRAAEHARAEPRRRPPPTAEVDPEDIEAAIELAPPARRPAAKNTIGVHRPKKPERPE